MGFLEAFGSGGAQSWFLENVLENLQVSARELGLLGSMRGWGRLVGVLLSPVGSSPGGSDALSQQDLASWHPRPPGGPHKEGLRIYGGC